MAHCALDACRQGRENCPSPMHCSGAVELSEAAIREIRLQVAMRAPIPRNDEAEDASPIPSANEVMRVVFICVGCVLATGLLAALIWPPLSANWARFVTLFAFT